MTPLLSSNNPPEMRLHNAAGARLYVNGEERSRILEAAHHAPSPARDLAQTLLFTGCRLSEALALRGNSVQIAPGVISVVTLKTRRANRVREIPVPDWLALVLAQRNTDPLGPLWHAESGARLPRSQGYRWIKRIMAAAEVEGPQACPKGLRHGFGVHALTCGVPLNMLQKWMGHASMSTTAIYANATGPEERSIAARMWDTAR